MGCRKLCCYRLQVWNICELMNEKVLVVLFCRKVHSGLVLGKCLTFVRFFTSGPNTGNFTTHWNLHFWNHLSVDTFDHKLTDSIHPPTVLLFLDHPDVPPFPISATHQVKSRSPISCFSIRPFHIGIVGEVSQGSWKSYCILNRNKKRQNVTPNIHPLLTVKECLVGVLVVNTIPIFNISWKNTDIKKGNNMKM